MSKSLGNYIGINEPPSEIFGKVMSIADELMWRYYELLTDFGLDEIAAFRRAADNNDRNPRDLKVELAKSIIADFHSKEDAVQAEEEFNRVFRSKQTPEDIEEFWVPYARYKLPRLLVQVPSFATSLAEARRLIQQGAVRINGERVTDVNFEVPLINFRDTVSVQIGKRRFGKLRLGSALSRNQSEQLGEGNDNDPNIKDEV
jgi:tyrosyl-tRNA synthetase